MIKLIRQTLNLNQDELADLLGVSKSAVCMYEKKTRQLTTEANERLMLLKQSWLHFLEDGLPPGVNTHTTPPDFEPFRIMVKACARKASVDAMRYSQLIEKMNKDRNLLEQKQLFMRYLMLQEKAGIFPVAVLKKIEQRLKKRLRTCCPVQQQILIFRLNSTTILQQLAIEAAKGMR